MLVAKVCAAQLQHSPECFKFEQQALSMSALILKYCSAATGPNNFESCESCQEQKKSAPIRRGCESENLDYTLDSGAQGKSPCNPAEQTSQAVASSQSRVAGVH